MGIYSKSLVQPNRVTILYRTRFKPTWIYICDGLPMNLPISAIKSLELSGVHYTSLNLDLTESDSPTVVMQSTIAKKQHVILVVLEDSIGKMQCALTQDCFIDLTLLCETLGRNLKGIEQVSITKLVHSFGLETMCGLPGLTNYPCIVSPQIMQADQLYFESGKSGALIKLDKKNILHHF